MTCVIQANLHHSRAATGVLLKRLDELKIKFALLQEPWIGPLGDLRGLGSFKGFIFHCNFNQKPRTAILSKQRGALLTDFLTRDLVAINVTFSNNNSFILASAYFANEPHAEIPTAEAKRLIAYCNELKLPLILSCDANAHNTLWGSSDNNRRGTELIEYIIEENLFLVNKGSTPTFVNEIREEVLDLTICNSWMIKKVDNWKVSLNESLSDHRHILFNINQELEKQETNIRDPKKTNWIAFKENLESATLHISTHQPTTINELELRASDVSSALVEAYENASPLKRVMRGSSPRWWNDVIEMHRREARRLYNEKKQQGRRYYKVQNSQVYV